MSDFVSYHVNLTLNKCRRRSMKSVHQSWMYTLLFYRIEKESIKGLINLSSSSKFKRCNRVIVSFRDAFREFNSQTDN